MDYKIYELKDPISNKARYIGMTINPDQRFKAHVACADRSNIQKNEWITQLKLQGLFPVMNIIEDAIPTKYEALVREQQWIKHHQNIGVLLLNINVDEPLPPVDREIVDFLLSCPWNCLPRPPKEDTIGTLLYEALPGSQKVAEEFSQFYDQPTLQWKAVQLLIRMKRMRISSQYVKLYKQIDAISTYLPHFAHRTTHGKLASN